MANRFTYGRPKMVHLMLSDRCPICLSVTLVHCGQTVGWIKMKLAMQTDLGPGHILLDGDPAPSLLWPNGCINQHATWQLGMEVGLRSGNCVRWGHNTRKKWHIHPTQFLGHVYYGYGRPSQLLASSCYISREASTAKAKCILVTTVCVSVCLTAEVNFFVNVHVRVCRFHCV